MIDIQHVSKSFQGSPALIDVSLHIPAGQFTVLIGTSGSGKSTLLKTINRLVQPDQGHITLNGQDIQSLSPEALRRRIGYAIQSVGLFPHWTIEQNIATVPTLLGWTRERIQARVHELLELLQLPPQTFLHRYPHQLSGGQQQRVGVARALAANPDVLLMDEPFGALDPVTRSNLQEALRHIHAWSGKTIVLVTHDLDEAFALGQHLVLLDQGRIVQQGTPQALLSQPANDFARQFLGGDELKKRRWGLDKVLQHVRPHEQADGLPIPDSLTLQEAQSIFITRGKSVLPVVDQQGQHVGALHWSDLLEVTA